MIALFLAAPMLWADQWSRICRSATERQATGATWADPLPAAPKPEMPAHRPLRGAEGDRQ